MMHEVKKTAVINCANTIKGQVQKSKKVSKNEQKLRSGKNNVAKKANQREIKSARTNRS